MANAFVANRIDAEQDELDAAAQPVDPDIGKSSPISETEAWSLERAVQNMAAREQATQATQAAPETTPGWINDDLLNYELGNYFAGVDEFNFTMDEGLMANVDSSLLASTLQRSNSPGPWMDDYGFPSESLGQNNKTSLLDSVLQPKVTEADMAAYMERQTFFTNATAFADTIDVGADTLTSMLKAGWATSAGIGKQADMFWYVPKLTMHQNWSFAGDAFKTMSNVAGVLSIGSSIGGALNETAFNPKGFKSADNPDGVDSVDIAREVVKLGFDGAALATATSAFSKLSPLGWIYTGLDVAVQLTPGYTVQFGQYKGETRQGFTKLMYMQEDSRQRAQNTLSPEAYHVYSSRI